MKTLNTYKRLLKLLFLTTVLSFCGNVSFAQFAPDLPQRSLSVERTQSISFGTFCLTGAGNGSITVLWDGTIPTPIGIVSLYNGLGAQPAIFAIKICQGRNVRITFPFSIPLTGIGEPLLLKIGPTQLGGNNALFTTNRDCDFVTLLRVGGTLEVPASARPGTYTGEFEIILNQE